MFNLSDGLFCKRAILLTTLCLAILASCQKLDPVPETSPMPSFLPWVYPAPDATLTVSEYHEGIFLLFEEVGGAICIELNGFEILEMDDSGLERMDFLDRGQLLVNGETGYDADPQIVIDFLGLGGGIVRIDPETGETTIIQESNATGPWIICWEIALEPGMQEIAFHTHKTSGEKQTYTWSFYIED
jgi:hypothetical protein